jgi:hypothetical protein
MSRNKKLPSKHCDINFNWINQFWIIIFFLIFPTTLLGQKATKKYVSFKPHWIISIGAGPSIAFTDVKKNALFPVSTPKSEWKFNANLLLIREINPQFKLHGQLIYSTLSGVNEQMDKYFNSDLFETNLTLSINIKNLFIPYHKNETFHFGAFTGFGLCFFNTDLHRLSDDYLISLRGHGAGSGFDGRALEGIFIFGFEADYKLDYNWGIRFETSARWMKSDQLEIEIAGFPYDSYLITSLGISYKLAHKPSGYPLVEEPLK